MAVISLSFKSIDRFYVKFTYNLTDYFFLHKLLNIIGKNIANFS